MTCQNCGHEFEGKFCPNCGTKAPQQPVTPPAATDFQPTPDVGQGYQTPADPSGAPVGGTPDSNWQQPDPSQTYTQSPYAQPAYSQQQYSQQPGWNQQTQWQGTPDGQPPKKKHTGLIIGCVIGGVVLVIVIVMILIFAFFGALRNGVTDPGDEPQPTYSTVIPDESSEPADPDPDTSSSAPTVVADSYPEGTYVVGQDIPAGEYLLQCSDEWGGYVEVRYDDNWGSFDDPDAYVGNDAFENRTYVRFEDGQYVQFERCDAIPADQAPAFDGSNGYPEGTYRVGYDIPAGQYTLTQTTEYEGYYIIFTDPADEMESIVENNLFEGSMTITVEEGQYLSLSLSEILPQ